MPVTEQCKLTYPNEKARDWYTQYESFAAELDAALFASREDRNLLVVSTEIAVVNAGGGDYTISWGTDIGIVAPTTGYYWILAAGSVTVNTNFPFAVIELSARGIQGAGVATISPWAVVPNTDTAFLLAMKSPVGSWVVFRNGVWVAADTQRQVFARQIPARTQNNDAAYSTPDIWYNTATGMWMMSTAAGGVSPLAASHIRPPAGDGYSGITTNGLLKEACVFGNVVYRDAAAGGWKKAKADAIGTMVARGMVVTLAGGGVNDVVTLLRVGYVKNSGWAWTDGDNLWVSRTVAGALQTTAPVVVGDVSQVVGGAESATLAWFSMNSAWAVV